MTEPGRILPPRRDWQILLCFQKAGVIHDITFRFAHGYLFRGDRASDRTIHSARSGKKNILEGGTAAQTSKETEIKLTNAVRGSLEKLLNDSRDHLVPARGRVSHRTRNTRRLPDTGGTG